MPLSKSRKLYYGIIFALIIIYGTLIYYFRSNEQVLGAVFLALVVAWHFIYRFLSQRSMSKVQQILTHQCDPEAYLNKLQHLFMDRSAKKEEPHSPSLQTWFVPGLIHSGKYDEAEAALSPEPVDPLTIPKRMLAITHASLFTSIFLYRGLLDNAAVAIDAMRKLADPKMLKSKYASLQRTIAYSECLLAIKRGQYEGAEDALLRFFDTTETPLNRVCIQFHLGELYLKLNYPEKAKAAFQYAADHGNKLHAAALAREALLGLQQA